MSRVIRKIETVSVSPIDTIFLIALIVIPADKVDRVAEVAARGGPATSLTLIAIPGSVQCLRIAIGARSTFPRDKAKQLGTRWTSIRAESDSV